MEKSRDQLIQELEELKCHVSQFAEKGAELKKTENKLRENQNRLVKAQRVARMSFWNWNLQTDEILLSDELYHMYALKPEEVATMPELINKTVYPDDIAFVRENLDLAKQDIQKFDIDHRVVHPNGSIIWVHTQAELTFDNECKPKTLLGTLVDITNRKRAEESLLLEKNKAQQYLDIAGVMLVAINDKEHVTLINRKGCEILGYAEEEIIGENWFDLVLPEALRHEIKRVYHELLSGNIEPVEYYKNPVLTKTGKQRTILWHNTVLKNDAGEINGILGSGEDITNRKKAEEALQNSELKYRALVENANDAIFVVQDGFVKLSNHKSEELSGYGQDELRKLFFPDAIHPEDRDMVLKNYEMRLKGEQIENVYPFRIITKNGDEKWGEINAGRIEWENKPAVLCCIRDISLQKELETQFYHAQKMEAIGILAGGIAHDFNNLLTSILGNISLAQDLLEKDHPIRKDLEEVEKAGNKAASLTRKLLTFSRKQMISPEVINLNDLINQSDKMLKRFLSEDIDLQNHLAQDLFHIKADSQQIEHVLINLVVNANEAMPQGGRLIIQTENVDLDTYYLNAHGVNGPPGDYVRISLSDTGKGMDGKTLAHIFDPFFTTKPTGIATGLGLSTAHGIVKRSNGFIRVYSEVGLGTTFKIYLPRFKENKNTSELKIALKIAPEGSETILIAEDNDMILKLASKILGSLGYRVLLAKTGEEALKIGDNFNEPIDLLLTDVIMPGINGIELAQVLKLHRNETRILFMSGYTGSKIIHDNILDLNMAFITKPFTKNALSQKVRQVLDESEVKLEAAV